MTEGQIIECYVQKKIRNGLYAGIVDKVHPDLTVDIAHIHPHTKKRDGSHTKRVHKEFDGSGQGWQLWEDKSKHFENNLPSSNRKHKRPKQSEAIADSSTDSKGACTFYGNIAMTRSVR